MREVRIQLRLLIGNHRAQLTFGDGAVVVTELQADRSFSSVLVRLEDARAHYERTKAHGVQISRAPADYPYGERQYSVQDFAGHCWTFSESIADLDPTEWGGTPGEL